MFSRTMVGGAPAADAGTKAAAAQSTAKALAVVMRASLPQKPRRVNRAGDEH